MAKVPIVKKNNHTICILAQDPNEIGKNVSNVNNKPESDQDTNQIHQQDNAKIKRQIGL